MKNSEQMAERRFLPVTALPVLSSSLPPEVLYQLIWVWVLHVAKPAWKGGVTCCNSSDAQNLLVKTT